MGVRHARRERLATSTAGAAPAKSTRPGGETENAKADDGYERAVRKTIGSIALAIILGSILIASLYSVWAATRPGLLSIYVGMSLAFFSSFVIAMRRFAVEALGIKGADSEISLVHALELILGASLLFVLLGLLNEMKAFPWW